MSPTLCLSPAPDGERSIRRDRTVPWLPTMAASASGVGAMLSARTLSCAARDGSVGRSWSAFASTRFDSAVLVCPTATDRSHRATAERPMAKTRRIPRTVAAPRTQRVVRRRSRTWSPTITSLSSPRMVAAMSATLSAHWGSEKSCACALRTPRRSTQRGSFSNAWCNGSGTAEERSGSKPWSQQMSPAVTVRRTDSVDRCCSHQVTSSCTHGDCAAAGDARRINQRERSSPRVMDAQRSEDADILASSRKILVVRGAYHGFPNRSTCRCSCCEKSVSTWL